MSRSLDCARDDTGNLSKVPTCFSANIHLSIMLTHSLSRLSNRFNSTNIRRSREQNKFICSAEAPQYMWTQSKHKKNSIIHDIMTDNVISSEAAGEVERSAHLLYSLKSDSQKDAINSSFFALDHFFNCFSRRIACRMSENVSK